MGAGDHKAGGGEFGSHPPLPKLTLRVGITGHRPKPAKLPPASYAFVQQRLGEVFANVDQALSAVHASQRDYFSGGPAVRLVSGLAEGADQFAIDVMPPSWGLDAVLPFPREVYAEDFSDEPGAEANSPRARYLAYLQRPQTIVTELPSVRRAASGADEDAGTSDTDEPAYARLGGFLLRQVDILVAVWDGKRGEKGGTGYVVAAAKGAGIPVVWIHSLQKDARPHMVERVDAYGNGFAEKDDCLTGPLPGAIVRIAGFPKPPPAQGHDSGILRKVAATAVKWLLRSCRSMPARDSVEFPDRLQAYKAETWPSAFFSFYDAFKRRAERKWPRRNFSEDAQSYRERWAFAFQNDLAVGPLRGQLQKVLFPRYVWADSLAVYYSHRYRSAYVVCYALAGIAVGVALLALFAHDVFHEGFLHAKAVLVALELYMIGKIVCIVYRGRDERWQEKWIEYRSLAELLFNMHFLSFLAEHGRTQRLSKLDTASNGWLFWYLGTTIREVGLPNAKLDAGYQHAALDALKSSVVQSQRDWHDGTSGTLHKMHHALHLTGVLCFGTTIVLLFAFLVAYAFTFFNLPSAHSTEEWLKGHALWLTAAAAFLPALGAAASSIRTTGDFGKVSERSRKTATALSLLSRETIPSDPTLEQTGDILLRTALVLAEDLDAWHLVYGDKRLELPA